MEGLSQTLCKEKNQMPLLNTSSFFQQNFHMLHSLPLAIPASPYLELRRGDERTAHEHGEDGEADGVVPLLVVRTARMAGERRRVV